MKAVVYEKYGPPDVLHLAEVARPTPKDNEILIKVLARPVTFGDITARRMSKIGPREFNMPLLFWVLSRVAFGWRKPRIKILGAELAGTVEAVGKDVTRFKVGDEVFGYPAAGFGANAEYRCMPETGLVALKPSNMSFEEAAAVPYGAMTALTLLRKGNIQRGQKVLINGASGSIGSYAVQIAKFYGAEVTGVCGTPRLELVKALGADHVIDYTQQDFTKNGERYDLIFDILGRSSFARCKNSLAENGRYLLASFKSRQLLQMIRTSFGGGKKVICALSTTRQQDLIAVKELAEAGTIKAIIGQCFPLEQTAEAHRAVEGGHKQGFVIVTSGERP